jgi:hypothetical protein
MKRPILKGLVARRGHYHQQRVKNLARLPEEVVPAYFSQGKSAA